MRIESMRVGVVGYGKSGRAAHALLEFQGHSVSIFEDPSQSTIQDIELAAQAFISEHQPEMLVISPGYPLQRQWLQDWRSQGRPLWGELGYALETLKNHHQQLSSSRIEKVHMLTGSVGKSTCSALLAEALKADGRKVFLGGNFGTPLSCYVLEVLKHKGAGIDDVVVDDLVLEVSSYQLECSKGLWCDTAFLVSLLPNHLDRYSSLGEYYATKWRLHALTWGLLYINSHSPELLSWTQNVLNNPELSSESKNKIRMVSVQETLKDVTGNPKMTQKPKMPKMIGEHNLQNIALIAAYVQDSLLDSQAFNSLFDFPGLAHRMYTLEGLRIHAIDDSKATTLESVRVAVSETRKAFVNHTLWVLLGGKDKGLPWETLSDLPQEQCNYVFFGDLADTLPTRTGLRSPNKQCSSNKQSSSSGVLSYPSLKQALDSLPQLVKNRDVVLLSPGGSSLDEFKNFEERGRFFQEKMKEYFSV